MILQPFLQTLDAAQTQRFGVVLDAWVREIEGGFSTPLPLKLAQHLKKPVGDIASALAKQLTEDTSYDVWLTDPGFINVRIPDSEWVKSLNSLLASPPIPCPKPVVTASTLQELRENLAQAILSSMGGSLQKKAGKVSSLLPLDLLEERFGWDAIAFALIESPIQAPIALSDASFRDSLDNPRYFIRHTQVRLTHLIKMAPEISTLQENIPMDSQELEVLQAILHFPSTLRQAVLQSDPCNLFRYALKLARLFDELYWSKRILTPEDRNDPFRMTLASGAQVVLGHVFNHIGLLTPVEL